ncbi:MAG: MazG nucleotide pyrophosphohydrolase [Gemmatimonadetes bacterium]|jgi:NTP pyrophosphatase (non-canonical NTP hydrolase)|nr:MazG nucleotide pyrophosphohydrolase [Gemmatimonadota bacterium]
MEAGLDAYQQAAVRTVNPALDADARLLDAACGLAEEAGEVLAHVRKHVMQGRPLDRAAAAEELGDALWCIAALARSLGLSLGEVGTGNLAKLRARHPDGFSADASG